MTTTDDEHARLVAVVADVFRAGLDDARVHLPPRAERQIIERAVELIELGGWTLVRVDEQPSQAVVW